MNNSLYSRSLRLLSFLLAGAGLLALNSCGGGDEPAANGEGTVTVNLIHRAGNNLLQGERSDYKLGLGNVDYTVEKLTYYLSGFALTNVDGERISFPTVALVDALNQTVLLNDAGDPTEGLKINLSDVPDGTYTSVSFIIGLNEIQNQTEGLPNLTDHINMAWPEPMGGGYHYMKFEGKFTNEQGEQEGFATHTGRLSNTIKTEDYYIPVSLSLTEPITISGREAQSFTLAHDADEWFANPNNNALQAYPSMIMGNHDAQEVFRANGSTVFYMPQ